MKTADEFVSTLTEQEGGTEMVQRTAHSLLLVALIAHVSLAASPKIAWYGTLKSGLAEAERSNRPILLVSAAPQCQNVGGMW